MSDLQMNGLEHECEISGHSLKYNNKQISLTKSR